VKTLYIISNGQDKLPEEEILRLEQENRFPRVTMLQNALSVDLVDERYLYGEAPKIRRIIYPYLPLVLAQIIETLILCRKYDVIFSHTERAGLPLALIMKIFRINKPHVMVISRVTSMDEKKARRKIWFLKKTHSQINRIIMWSSVQKEFAVKQLGIPASKIARLNSGTDQEFWKGDPLADTDMICAVGMEMRDYPTLIEALRGLDIPCHIAAGHLRGVRFKSVDDIDSGSYENLPKNITVGEKEYEDLRKLYERSRFVVVPLLPTDSDNGLTTIQESMSMGKTVICSRVEGQVDVIKEGETGIFVPQGDPEALRKAIIDLWNNPEKARKMGQAARRYIEEHRTIEQFVQGIKNVVEEVIAESKKEGLKSDFDASKVEQVGK
jgi:glycosyltransferase involved in cell wall biosynthesis